MWNGIIFTFTHTRTHTHTHAHTHTQSLFVPALVCLSCILCSWTTVSLCVSLIRDGHSSLSLIIDPPSEISHHSTADVLPLHSYLTDLRAAGAGERGTGWCWGRALVKMLRVDRHTCLKSSAFEPSCFRYHKVPADFDGLITARCGPFSDMFLTLLFYHIRAFNLTHLRVKSPGG